MSQLKQEQKNHTFYRMQRLEKEFENNVAMNKCREIQTAVYTDVKEHENKEQMELIEKESADILILEQQLPRRSYKSQMEHTKPWGTCYREGCLEQKSSVHLITLELEKPLSFWVSKPKTAIFNTNFLRLIDGDTHWNPEDYLLSRKRWRPIGVT